MQPIQRFTPYEQLLVLPDNLVGEIINSQVYTQPRPSGPHANVSSALGGELWRPYQKGRGGPGGWWLLDEPEIHFIRDLEVLVPDLAGWRRETMPNLPKDQRFEVVPDWICEVLSPSTESKDRKLKMPLYAKYGVHYAWLVDPLEKTFEVFELVDKQWSTLDIYRGEEKVSAPPFKEVTIRLTDLWY